MSEHGQNEMGNIPTWLQLFLATITGAIVGTSALVRWAFTIDRRMQRIENQDLENIIGKQISDDWHNNRAPMLQTRIFTDIDKMESLINALSRDVATLMERDRLNQRMEQVISALNAQALKPPHS